MRPVLAVLSALFLAAMAFPAAASDVKAKAECVWQALPSDRRDAFVGFPDEDPRFDVLAFFGEDAVWEVAVKCGVTPDDERATGGDFTSVALQHVAENRLAKFGLTPAQLDEAWRQMDPVQARILGRALRMRDEAQSMPLLDTILPMLGARLKLGDEASNDLRLYVVCRSMREFYENDPQF